MPERASPAVPRRPELPMWVLYGNPSDFPNQYVVRRWEITGEGMTTPITPVCVTSDLARAHAAIPRGLYRLGRQPNDDPAIVDVWI